MKTKRTRGAGKGSAAPQVPGTPPAEGSAHRTVRFDVHLGGAREVYVAGTFNEWRPTTLPMIDMGLGRWEKEVVLDPGVYEYLFVADGRWIPDPTATEFTPNPYGGVNAVLRVG